MKIKSIVIVVFLLVVFSFGFTADGTIAAGMPQHEAELLYSPAAVDVIGQGLDYASYVIGDPWDMDAITDIYNEKTQNINSTSGTNRMAIEGGELVGTTQSNDPQIFLVWPAYTFTYDNYTKYGAMSPIDADTYRYLVIRMSLSNVQAADRGKLLWARNDQLTLNGVSNFFTLEQGWHTYVLDLATIGIQTGTEDWNGLMTSLRLTPTTRSGVDVKIDWVRLVEDTPPSSTITWTNSTGLISLYATPQNSEVDKTTPIVIDHDASTLSYDWDAGLMPADTYYVYYEQGAATGYRPKTVEVTQAPIAVITSPSISSGGDYATDVMNDPWDMDELSDVAQFDHLTLTDLGDKTQYRTDGVTVNIGPPPTGDPSLTMRIGEYWTDRRTGIDPMRYHYLSWDHIEYRKQDTAAGSISRILFAEGDPRLFDSVSIDTVINEGWNNYWVDLYDLALEAGSIPWNTMHEVSAFRFDPDEFPSATLGEVDNIRLTQQPWANDSFTVMWDKIAGDSSATVKVHYDTDMNFNNGTVGSYTATLGAGQYVWDTSSVPEGEYYIHLRVNDGVNTPRVFTSKLPVMVKNPANVSLTLPGSWTAPAEFSKDVAGNAWNFSENNTTDLDSFGGGYSQMTAPTFANGILSARTTGTDPVLYFNMGGKTLQASNFKTVTFRMFSGKTSGPIQGQIKWFNPLPGGTTDPFDIYPGWHTYHVDLSTDAQWTGTVKYIRLDPATESGVDFKLDWFALTAPASYQISWTRTNFNADTRLSLFAVRNSSNPSYMLELNNEIRISPYITSGTSYNWDFGGLDLNDYYILAVVDDRISPLNFADSREPIPNIQSSDTVYAGLNQTDIRSEISVKNDASTPFTWKATTSNGWINLINPGPHSSDTSDTLKYSIDTSGLSANTYNGKITITTTYNTVDTPHQVDIKLVLWNVLYQSYLPSVFK